MFCSLLQKFKFTVPEGVKEINTDFIFGSTMKPHPYKLCAVLRQIAQHQRFKRHRHRFGSVLVFVQLYGSHFQLKFSTNLSLLYVLEARLKKDPGFPVSGKVSVLHFFFCCVTNEINVDNYCSVQSYQKLGRIFLEGGGSSEPGSGQPSPTFSNPEGSVGMLFPEVMALGIARAPRCGCMGTQSCGGASQLAGSSFVYFSQEPQADDCLRLEVKERQQCNFIWL